MIRTAKKVIVLLCWILLFAGMSGCLSGGAQEERISVAFQVVAFDKAPQKLQEIIEEHKKEEIKMTWEGDEGRYIIRGYGEQPTGGYSIRADAGAYGRRAACDDHTDPATERAGGSGGIVSMHHPVDREHGSGGHV